MQKQEAMRRGRGVRAASSELTREAGRASGVARCGLRDPRLSRVLSSWGSHGGAGDGVAAQE